MQQTKQADEAIRELCDWNVKDIRAEMTRARETENSTVMCMLTDMLCVVEARQREGKGTDEKLYKITGQ